MRVVFLAHKLKICVRLAIFGSGSPDLRWTKYSPE